MLAPLLPDSATLNLGSLFRFSERPVPDAGLFIAGRTLGRRFITELPQSLTTGDGILPHGWWAISKVPCAESDAPVVLIGDSPSSYHPLYLAAVLETTSPPDTAVTPEALAQIAIPLIKFSSPEDVRRSMTLNGMRMTTEYMATGSPRVLGLVENRLQAGQSDIIHDVLVYIMRQIVDTRDENREARNDRADSVAAYLGIDTLRVRRLFAPQRLSPARIAATIAGNAAGPVRRQIDVAALVAAQITHLRDELAEPIYHEKLLLDLLDQIMGRLRATDGMGNVK